MTGTGSDGLKTLHIDGGNVHDIPTFYAEINRVFMADEEWKLADSLDAFDDLLYGGYGAVKGREPVRLVWTDAGASKSALGIETTRDFLAAKLQRPERFDTKMINRQLEALEGGTGQTYFEIVLEIIGDHENIELVLA